MFTLSALFLKWRLKWIFACGLGFGVARFAFSALNTKGWLLVGVALHGVSFTMVMITAQIYLDQRVDPSWRSRAQALLSLMNSGIGNLLGYLGTGWWFAHCTAAYRNELGAVLGRTLRECGSGAGLFSGGLSRDRSSRRWQALAAKNTEASSKDASHRRGICHPSKACHKQLSPDGPRLSRFIKSVQIDGK